MIDKSIEQKRCLGCKQVKLLSEFDRHQQRLDGLYSRCRECRPRPALNEKRCWKCKTVKPAENFCKNQAKRDGLADECRTCAAASASEYLARCRASHPDPRSPKTKCCPKCQIVKPASGFKISRASKDGLGRWCIPCATAARAELNLKMGQREVLTTTEKRCFKCHIIKNASEFRPNIKAPDRLTSWCATCLNVASALSQKKRYDLPEISTPIPGGMKRCAKCETIKYLNSFANDRNQSDGKNRTCRKCFKGTRNIKNTQTKDRARLLKVYGITQADIVWRKHNGSSFHADRFRRIHEHVVQFYRGGWAEIYKSAVTTPDATARTVRTRKRPVHMGHIDSVPFTSVDGGPRLQRSVIDVPSCHGYADHPTQKPVGILTPLIEYSCPPGGMVLDPTCGSGSTLEAAKHLGRKAIGVEINEANCEVAANRLSKTLPFT